MKESGLFPNLDFVDVHSKKDKASKCKMSPDIVVYLSGATCNVRLSFAHVEVIIEWKVDAKTDGFRRTRHEGEVFEASSNDAKEFRGQMFSYAGQVLNSQHRVSVIGLSFHGDLARAYHFDPSCVVVSEPIFYRENPDPILEIFWRYSAMSPTQRGYDPTVTPANREEKRLFQTCVKDYLARVKRDNLRKHPDVERLGDNIVKIQVNDETDGTVHSYLACRPPPKKGYVCAEFSPCGQMPRGFIATPITSTTVEARDGPQKIGRAHV